MRKTGRNSLLQRFQRFNLSEVPPKVRTKAENIFRKFTEDEVRKTSAGAASFFVWVSNSRAIEKGKVFVRVLIIFLSISKLNTYADTSVLGAMPNVMKCVHFNIYRISISLHCFCSDSECNKGT